jgi:hypothetical protein
MAATGGTSGSKPKGRTRSRVELFTFPKQLPGPARFGKACVMKADFESERAELAKRGAGFCHNPREAVMEWNAIRSGFADAIECLSAGSFSIFEMSICRVRLERFMESFSHSLKRHPEVFDAESLRVLSQLEALTLEWIRQAAKTKGHRFVDTPGERWMGAWQDFCVAYGSFSQAVEFALSYEELKQSRQGKHGGNRLDADMNSSLPITPAVANQPRAVDTDRLSVGIRQPANSDNVSQSKPPSQNQLQAYVLHKVMGKRQVFTAEKLLTNQGTISRWVSYVEKWLKAGGNCPELSEMFKRITALDPSHLELGKRRDGMSRTARPKKSED